jgi:hypothetical protein
MPLSSIVVIVIRLFALNWFLTAASLFLSALASPVSHSGNVAAVLTVYAAPVLLFVLAAGLWILAHPVARFVSRGVDIPVSIGSLSRSDLYSFAFVFLGLFFILSSFADVINWIHYFATAPSDNPRHAPRGDNFYQLTRPCLTLALGLVSLLGAPSWTKKLVAYDQKAEAA